MTPFPGSSDRTLLQPPSAATAITDEVRDKLAALATDDPLPPPPARDRIRLLVQSPYRIFLYWNFAENPFISLARAFGERAAGFRFGVRLRDETNGTVEFRSAMMDATGQAGEYWFTVRPGGIYSAQVGFMTERNFFIRSLSSDTVRTPRISVSPHVDAAPAFVPPPDEFVAVLRETGYVSDALAVKLEAADERSAGALSRSMTSDLFDTTALDLSDVNASDLRALLRALATNASLDTVALPVELSEQLRAYLSVESLAELQHRLALRLDFEFEEFDGIETFDLGVQTWSSFSLSGQGARAPRRRRRESWLPGLTRGFSRPTSSAHAFSSGTTNDF
jgi:hypothetical protein